MKSTASAEFLAKPTTNPIEVLMDPRVLMTAGGVLGANMARKAAFTQLRGMFGEAVTRDGAIVYLGAEAEDGSRPELPGARFNRLLLYGGGVLAASVIIGRVQDANVDYAALGFGASMFANLLMTVLNFD